MKLMYECIYITSLIMFLIPLNASLHCSTELLLWHIIWCLDILIMFWNIHLFFFDASFEGCTIFHPALLWQVTSYFHLNISGMCFRWNYWMYISLQITLMHSVIIFINREVAHNGTSLQIKVRDINIRL